MDRENAKILDVETNYHTHRFIESFYINSDENTVNEKRWHLFPDIYRFILQ